jgi:outer membrane biosynthesis protein TonB
MDLMTQGVIPSEDDERRTLLEVEITRQAVVEMPRATASTSQEEDPASVSITHEKPSDNDGLLDDSEEQKKKAPKPKPKPRKKNPEIAESSANREGKKSEPKSVETRKSQTHLSSTGASTDLMSSSTGGLVISSTGLHPTNYSTHVDKVGAMLSESPRKSQI